MLTDKQLKEKYKKTFWKDPHKYYPTQALEEQGFTRAICKKCRKPYWSTEKRTSCGDPQCNTEESFGFIGKSPAKNKLSYLEVWTKFSKLFKKFGYTTVDRYPIVARWNPTMEYTNASIAAFQPFVISGEVEPPAKKVTIPQFSFRTVDIDNVGITGSHLTVFNMIGQLQFLDKKEWDQQQAFREIYEWVNKGIGLHKKDVTFIEDSWAGGGNFGCCLEFFSKGCELGNQVYMLYEQTPNGVQDLKKRVLDMGMGMERNAWFSQGNNTIYDATFPEVNKKLLKLTGYKINDKLIKKYVPYAGMLNIDEVADINKTWKVVAKKVGVEVKELRKELLPLAAIYSIAEHSRGLLITLTDGALPSNVGGGYNLRVMYRRALSFIDQYKWNIDLNEVVSWHAKTLKKVWPEFEENLEDVKNILEVEKRKYKNTVEKSKHVIQKLLTKKITEKDLLQLYDSQGINPELVQKEAKKQKKEVKVPDNFYGKVAELHEKKEQKHTTQKELVLNLEGVHETKILYYNDTKKTSFKAKIVKQLGKFIVLNETYFYPTSGGQMHDKGTIQGEEVVDIFKQGKVVVHMLQTEHVFPEGEEVTCEIDKERRLQLSQNHTGAHILNAAAKRVLGNHINQAGAFKDVDKSRLDITHYQGLTEEELKKIEKEANKIISDKIPIYKSFMNRSEAEKTHGMAIYQGGVPIGKELRIVDIAGVDVECCGGTHLDNTFEVALIKLLKSSKISDSIVRLEYVAGKGASKEIDKEKVLLADAASILKVEKNQVPARAQELFKLWKANVKKGKELSTKLTSDEEMKGRDKELLEKTAELLKTQPEHVPKTLRRFKKELNIK
tara:strand:- start:33270 stop:35780 length:2511 start_codon:yes stop_codon:yes gene_type:complete